MHPVVTGHKPFKKSGNHQDRNNTYKNFQAIFCTLFERSPTPDGAREEKAFAKNYSCRTGEDDTRDLQRAMNKHCENEHFAQALRCKHIVKGTDLNAKPQQGNNGWNAE